MARELRVTYTTAASTLYAIIRKKSDDTVWNGTAFETWANGSIASYDVPLTDRGGDVYSADFPSGIGADNYSVTYYEQAGGTPAISDQPLLTEDLYWNGQAASSASDVSLSSYALTTLDSLKRHMDITDSDEDTKLTELINGVSAEIERVTGVAFKARDYRQWLNGANQREVVLPHYPVQHVTRIAFGVANALSLTYTGGGIRASASIYKDPESPDAGGLRIQSVSTSGVPTTTNLSFATYRSCSALETAIELVNGWSATVLQNVPTLDLHPGVGGDALNLTVTLTYPDRDEYNYAIDHDIGTLRFSAGNGFWTSGYRGHTVGPEGVSGWYGPQVLPRQFQGCLIEYRAGYEAIPADVSTVANRLVQDLYYESQIGAGVTELKLGPGVIKLDAGQEDSIREDLKHYIDYSRMIGGVR